MTSIIMLCVISLLTYQTLGMAISSSWGSTTKLNLMTKMYDIKNRKKNYPSGKDILSRGEKTVDKVLSKLQQSSSAAASEVPPNLGDIPYFIDTALRPFSSKNTKNRRIVSGREVLRKGKSRVDQVLPKKPVKPMVTPSTDIMAKKFEK